jgi:hypothetical protein
MKGMHMPLSPAEISELRSAKTILENPGLAAKVSNFIGAPIEKGFKMLPASWGTLVNAAAHKSIEAALVAALLTLDKDRRRNAVQLVA